MSQGISPLGLFKFYWTDAIAGISGGTTIKYVDVNNGTNVKSYGNIVGSYVVSCGTYDTLLGSIIVLRTSDNSAITAHIALNGSISTTVTSNIKHRVFYF